jgi:hypothetical protein
MEPAKKPGVNLNISPTLGWADAGAGIASLPGGCGCLAIAAILLGVAIMVEEFLLMLGIHIGN